MRDPTNDSSRLLRTETGSQRRIQPESVLAEALARQIQRVGHALLLMNMPVKIFDHTKLPCEAQQLDGLLDRLHDRVVQTPSHGIKTWGNTMEMCSLMEPPFLLPAESPDGAHLAGENPRAHRSTTGTEAESRSHSCSPAKAINSDTPA